MTRSCPCLAAMLLACTDSGSALFEAARDKAVAGEHRAALELAERASGELREGDPRRAKALAMAGDLSYLYLGDLRGAIRHYKRLCEEAPGAEEAFTARARLGDLYRDRLGDLPSAVEQYQALIAGFPGRPEIADYRHRVAKSYLALKDYEQARVEARALYGAAPEGPLADDALYLVALAYQAEGRRAEALAAFRATVDRFPRSSLAALAWVEVGNLLAERGDDAGALEAWAQAEQGHPDPHAVQELSARARRRLALRSAPPEAYLTR